MSYSPFKTLFLALQERILQQVPEIRYIDQDLGQLNEERPPLSYPAILIDFSNFNYENLAEHKQTAEGIVVLKLIFDIYSNSNNLSPESVKDKALSFYDTEWKIYKVLQAWKPEDTTWSYGYMLRTSVVTEGHYIGLRVRNLQFSITFEDNKAQLQYDNTTLPAPDINVEEDNNNRGNYQNPFRVTS